MKDVKVAVLGASKKETRYSYKAMAQLIEHGYDPIPVHPAFDEILGKKVVNTLDQIDRPIHTLTVYVSPKLSHDMIDDIVRLRPKRVILNPGTESKALTDACRAKGIAVQEACTLVLLSTGQFLDTAQQKDKKVKYTFS